MPVTSPPPLLPPSPPCSDIVVLADRPKGELDAEVERALHGSGMSFVTRRGVPYSAKVRAARLRVCWCWFKRCRAPDGPCCLLPQTQLHPSSTPAPPPPSTQDLDTVAAAHAKTVLLLHPDHDEAAEVHKTATLLALQSCRSHPSTTLLRQRVIVQNPDTPAPGRVSEADAAHHSVARVVRRSLPPSANMKLIEVNGSRNMARLIAQSAVQPGVSTILGQVRRIMPGGRGAAVGTQEAPTARVVRPPTAFPPTIHLPPLPLHSAGPARRSARAHRAPLTSTWSPWRPAACQRAARASPTRLAGHHHHLSSSVIIIIIIVIYLFACLACAGCVAAPRWRRAAHGEQPVPPPLPTRAASPTPQEARRKLANSVVLGVLSHRDRTTAMNPPDTARLLRGDRLIVLSHGVRSAGAGWMAGWWRDAGVPTVGCCHHHASAALLTSWPPIDPPSLPLPSPAWLAQAVPELAPGGSTAAGLDLAALQQRLQAAQPPASSAKAIVVVGWSGPTNDLLVRRAEGAWG